MVSSPSLVFAGLFLCLHLALAGFSSSSTSNIAVYWGQNSAATAGLAPQERLSFYCKDNNINTILLSFLLAIKNPTVNFANAGDNCTAFSNDPQLLSCPQIEEDIKTCQSTGKTIMLSIGGATYTEGGFTSPAEAEQYANTVWQMFGPNSNNSVDRPFGTAIVDGFDFDFESKSPNLAPFAATIRNNMNSATKAGGKTYYLSAAPQCPFPDAADNDMLEAVSFDFVNVQFYNNYCGASSFVAGSSTENNFNFATWDNWAKTNSTNPDVKVLLGIPANTGAGGGYVSGTKLADVTSYSKNFSSFGGIMMWDMSQLYANAGFLSAVVSDLGASAGNGSSPTTTATTTAPTSTPTTLTTATITTTGGSSTTTVPQWGQCGGNGYAGSTTCESPYKCDCTSAWWCQCQEGNRHLSR